MFGASAILQLFFHGFSLFFYFVALLNYNKLYILVLDVLGFCPWLCDLQCDLLSR